MVNGANHHGRMPVEDHAERIRMQHAGFAFVGQRFGRVLLGRACELDRVHTKRRQNLAVGAAQQAGRRMLDGIIPFVALFVAKPRRRRP